MQYGMCILQYIFLIGQAQVACTALDLAKLQGQRGGEEEAGAERDAGLWGPGPLPRTVRPNHLKNAPLAAVLHVSANWH